MAVSLTPNTKTTLSVVAWVTLCALYLDRRIATSETGRAADQKETQYEIEKIGLRLSPIETLARDAASKNELRAFAEDLEQSNQAIGLRVPKVR